MEMNFFVFFTDQRKWGIIKSAWKYSSPGKDSYQTVIIHASLSKSMKYCPFLSHIVAMSAYRLAMNTKLSFCPPLFCQTSGLSLYSAVVRKLIFGIYIAIKYT